MINVNVKDLRLIVLLIKLVKRFAINCVKINRKITC